MKKLNLRSAGATPWCGAPGRRIGEVPRFSHVSKCAENDRRAVKSYLRNKVSRRRCLQIMKKRKSQVEFRVIVGGTKGGHRARFRSGVREASLPFLISL